MCLQRVCALKTPPGTTCVSPACFCSRTPQGHTCNLFMTKKAVHLSAMTLSVCRYGHVLWTVDVPFLRRALEFEVEGQRKKVRVKRAWKKPV